MTGYFLKNPDSVLDFSFDWGFQFLEGGETIETDLGWSVHPDTVSVGGVAIDSNSSTSTTTTAILSGGQPGEAYLVASRIRTTLGREIRRSLTVRIGNI